MPRTSRLLAVVAVLALVPAVASAQSASPDTAPAPTSRSVPGAGLDQLDGQLDETGREREVAERRLDAVRDAEGDARTALVAADQQLEDAEVALRDLEAQLAASRAALAAARDRADDARVRLADVTAELAAAEVELADRQARLQARVRAAFKYGHVSLAEALVGVRDIADFLNSSTYVAHVLDGDRELLAEVAGLLAAVEAQQGEARELRLRAEQEAAVIARATTEVEDAIAEQARLTELVRARRVQQRAALEALRVDRAAIEGHLAGLDAESRRIEEQLAAIAREQAEEARRARAQREADEADEAARLDAERRARDQADRDAAAPAAGTPAPRPAPAPTPPAAPNPAPPASGAASGPAPSSGTSGGGAAERAPAEGEPDAGAPSGGDAAGGVGGPASGGTWTRPVGGALTSPFGPRWGRNHNGVDLGGSVGTTVVATRAGTVVHVTAGCHPTSSWGCGGGFGNYVTVAHADGMASIYAHLSTVAVGVGETVGAGQAVGAIGNSGNSYGPHLHFEIRDGGAPRDPCRFIAC